jgi:hypothetical protein
VNDKLDKDVTIISAIASLEDPQIAYSLLRHCASFGLAAHYMRTAGPAADYARFDVAVRDAFDIMVGPLPVSSWSQIQLPFRCGGFGLRPTRDHAALAYCVSSTDALRYRAALLHPEVLLGDDWALALAVADPILAVSPSSGGVLEYVRARIPAASAQRSFSRLLEDGKFVSLLASARLEDQARLRSCAAPHASGWLSVVPSDDLGLHFPPAAFVTLCQFRLGLPVTPGERPCRLCHGKVISDVLLKAQPTKRFAQVTEIGALTVFLASDAASSITGAALPVDGGWTAH